MIDAIIEFIELSNPSAREKIMMKEFSQLIRLSKVTVFRSDLLAMGASATRLIKDSDILDTLNAITTMERVFSLRCSPSCIEWNSFSPIGWNHSVLSLRGISNALFPMLS
jgi:hypothetical protein